MKSEIRAMLPEWIPPVVPKTMLRLKNFSFPECFAMVQANAMTIVLVRGNQHSAMWRRYEASASSSWDVMAVFTLGLVPC